MLETGCSWIERADDNDPVLPFEVQHRVLLRAQGDIVLWERAYRSATAAVWLTQGRCRIVQQTVGGGKLQIHEIIATPRFACIFSPMSWLSFSECTPDAAIVIATDEPETATLLRYATDYEDLSGKLPYQVRCFHRRTMIGPRLSPGPPTAAGSPRIGQDG
jgi:hypothetical protein